MIKYVESPNLPKMTGIVLIGEKYSKILGEPLKKRGIDVLFVPDNPEVDIRVSGHADLSVIHLGRNRLAMAPYLKGSGLAKKLTELNFELIFPEMQQGKKYPKDAGFNVCICGKYFFFNPKSAEKSIVEYLTIDEGKISIPIKQGYSKCSICVVNENSIITSDIGIHKRAVEAGLDSLLIGPGYIELPGYDFGFVGGASFKLSDHELAFTGSLDEHPDKGRIFEFLSLHNINPVYITEISAFDIGSCIQIVEK